MSQQAGAHSECTENYLFLFAHFSQMLQLRLFCQNRLSCLAQSPFFRQYSLPECRHLVGVQLLCLTDVLMLHLTDVVVLHFVQVMLVLRYMQVMLVLYLESVLPQL